MGKGSVAYPDPQGSPSFYRIRSATSLGETNEHPNCYCRLSRIINIILENSDKYDLRQNEKTTPATTPAPLKYPVQVSYN